METIFLSIISGGMVWAGVNLCILGHEYEEEWCIWFGGIAIILGFATFVALKGLI